MTDTELHNHARTVLTPKQLEVWLLAEGGMTERGIALALGLARGTVRDHLEAATRRLRATGAQR